MVSALGVCADGGWLATSHNSGLSVDCATCLVATIYVSEASAGPVGNGYSFHARSVAGFSLPSNCSGKQLLLEHLRQRRANLH